MEKGDIEITPWKIRTHEFTDTTQRVNKKSYKHFPWCNLFIL